MSGAGNFVGVVDVEALSPRLFRNIIAADDIYLSYYGSVDAKRGSHLVDVAKGIWLSQTARPGGQLVLEGVDVELWRYRYYCEWLYVDNLCDLPKDLIHSWRCQYMERFRLFTWIRTSAVSFDHRGPVLIIRKYGRYD